MPDSRGQGPNIIPFDLNLRDSAAASQARFTSGLEQATVKAKNPNPNAFSVSGSLDFAIAQTIFPSTQRSATATFTSSGFNCVGINSLALFLDITAISGGGYPPTLVIDAQSQDPISGNWAYTNMDLFSSVAVVGTFYAQVGPAALDQNIRFIASVGGTSANATFSLSGLFKGSSALITPEGAGYIAFYRNENGLYAVTLGNPVTMRLITQQPNP